MKLNLLLKVLDHPVSSGGGCTVAAVTEDSRRVVPGTLFVAVGGGRADGHDYAEAAANAGAAAILGDRADLTELHGVPYIFVAHPREALGVLAHHLAGDPTKAMTVVGITGTNGKSSSVVLAQHVLNACGAPTSCFGTLGYDIAGEMIPAPHTTPFGEDLAEMFRRAHAAGQTHVVMEVSSHALEQERVAGIDFNVAMFTNLTQDHLDYHQDMGQYRDAKLRLFERVTGEGRFTVVNWDDPSAPAFLKASHVPCITYGHEGDCRARDIDMASGRTHFAVDTPWGEADVDLGLLGRHNVSNALGVIAICGGLGLPLENVTEALSKAPCVPGRFEHVDAGQDFQVIVDYAHTDDGLRNVLQASREICDGRVIVVFGCGGDRDRGKRPKMARVAADLADYGILTSDNPRTEDPGQILQDVEAGMMAAQKKKPDDYDVISDRADAIRQGISMAKPGDLVMIAGKGHEDYQILGETRIHFDDREVARSALGGT